MSLFRTYLKIIEIGKNTIIRQRRQFLLDLNQVYFKNSKVSIYNVLDMVDMIGVIRLYYTY